MTWKQRVGENHLHNLKSIYCWYTHTSPSENVLQQVEWNAMKRTTVQLYLYLKETKHYSQTEPVILKIPPNSEERLPISDLSAHANRAESAFPGVLKTSWQFSQIQQLRSSFLQLLSSLFFLLYDLYFPNLVQALYVFLQRYIFTLSAPTEMKNTARSGQLSSLDLGQDFPMVDTETRTWRTKGIKTRCLALTENGTGERYLSQSFDNA